MNYFIEGDKKLVCQDRNGDILWSHSSEDDLQNFNLIDSVLIDEAKRKINNDFIRIRASKK